MAWITTIEPEHAEGLLRKIYDAAKQRAGKVFNVIKLQSLRPKVLRTTTQLYTEIMHEECGLSRKQREMLAVAVSKANACIYWARTHADDLRAEIADEVGTEALINSLLEHHATAELAGPDRRMLDFSVKLTRAPWEIREYDINRLRDVGFDDGAILDIVQCTALFNYYNRLADGLGVVLESEHQRG